MIQKRRKTDGTIYHIYLSVFQLVEEKEGGASAPACSALPDLIFRLPHLSANGHSRPRRAPSFDRVSCVLLRCFFPCLALLYGLILLPKILSSYQTLQLDSLIASELQDALSPPTSLNAPPSAGIAPPHRNTTLRRRRMFQPRVDQ